MCAGKQTRAGLDSRLCPSSMKVTAMLQTIAIVLVVLWLIGLVTSNVMGGFIHILLVIAVVIILLRIIQGRRL